MPYEQAETALLRTFGERVRELRRERTGLSQENFARECGLARTYVASLERGQRNVSLLNICRIAEALGVPPAELLRFSPPSLLGGEPAAPEPGHRPRSTPASGKGKGR